MASLAANREASIGSAYRNSFLESESSRGDSFNSGESPESKPRRRTGSEAEEQADVSLDDDTDVSALAAQALIDAEEASRRASGLPTVCGIAEPILTPFEATGIQQMRDSIGEETLRAMHPAMRVAAESETSYLLRFLRARKLKVPEAVEMVIANHEWRIAEKIDELAEMNARDVLGCEVTDIWPYLPCWTQGYDRSGRPIIFKHWGEAKSSHHKEAYLIIAILQATSSSSGGFQEILNFKR